MDETVSARIFLAEWVPSLNKGELAILLGILETFSVFKSYTMSVLSFMPEIDGTRYPSQVSIIDAIHDLKLEILSKSYPIRLEIIASIWVAFQHIVFIVLYKMIGMKALNIMKAPIWKTYVEVDVIMMCHDAVSLSHGFVLPFCPYYISLLANALSKKLVVYGNGSTHSSRRIFEMLLQSILAKVDLVTTRDHYTEAYFKSLSDSPNKIHFCADPAILMPPLESDVAKLIKKRENISLETPPLFGVTITRQIIMGSGDCTLLQSDEIYNCSIRLWADCFDLIIQEMNVSLVFIPHCIEPYGDRDDRTVAQDIYQHMKNRKNTYLIGREFTPQELKSFIGSVDVLIAARIHSAIAALSMNTPTCTLSIPGDMRALGLVEGIFQQGNWIYGVERMIPAELVSHLKRLWQHSNDIRTELKDRNEDISNLTMRNGRMLYSLFKR